MWKNKSWILHRDNTPAHNILPVKCYLAARCTPVLKQVLYSSDLAPCDFFIFPKIKSALKGTQCESMKVVIPIIPIFMIDLNRKWTIKENWIDRKISKKKIDLLTDLRSIIYLRLIINFFIKLWSSLIDRIYILTMKNKIEKSTIRKWKDRSYTIENLWSDWKIDFWKPINRSWSKIDFWSESLDGRCEAKISGAPKCPYKRRLPVLFWSMERTNGMVCGEGREEHWKGVFDCGIIFKIKLFYISSLVAMGNNRLLEKID